MIRNYPALTFIRNLGSLMLLIFIISGCSKSDDSDPLNNNNNNNNCTKPAPPVLTSNSPVNYGDDIQLTTSDVEGAIAYNWSGPNNFTAQSQNPVIYSASHLDAGTYKVSVTIEGWCTSDTVSTDVQVIMPAAPCSPVNNQYTLAGLPVVNFVTWPFPTGGSGNFAVTCNGSNGDLHIEFATSSRPEPGVYRVTQLGSLALLDEVSVSNTTSSSYWSTSSGFVYVTKVGTKLKFVYCDLSFYSSTWGMTTLGSGCVLEP